MAEQSAFAVPKEKQLVTVYLLGGETLEGNIYLEFFSSARTLHQKMLAFLEDRNAFFPLSSGGAPAFLHKGAIRMVEIHYPEEDEAFKIMHVELVTMIFRDGSQVSGDLMADVPAEKRRLLDCMNLPDRFLSMKVYGKVCYINKEAVQKVLVA